MLNSPLPPDVTVTDRLQTVISEWNGEQTGHTLERLYQDCLDLVGQEKQLLPIKIMPVRELDSESLNRALRKSSQPLQYDSDTVGRFESAMVPILRESGPAAGFLFVYEEELSISNQVALFAHAVGHLILNQQEILKEHEPPLNPESGDIHTDRLAELRYLDAAKNRNLLDRQVLNAFPKLTRLIEPPEESQIKLDMTIRALEPLLRRKGWVNQFLSTPYRYTRGRVIPYSQQRGKRMTIDALLRAEASLPIAVVHMQRQEEALDEAIGRVRSAIQQIQVPFAFVFTQQQEVIELNWLDGILSDPLLLKEIPGPAELLDRWLSTLQLTDAKERATLSYPYDLNQIPRYYQEIAINQAVIAVLQARKGLRERRILLTLATGTGKTQVAFQILWKLKKTYRVRNVLFLADRGYLLEQAQTNAFGPFGDAIVRGMGEIDTAHDLLFGSYQWLTFKQDEVERYEGYPHDYFDVIVIDECHRGSADENSRWRKVLEHFSGAIQIGLTATPLETQTVQTNTYFGRPVYTYSLSQGINDGFLAPYSVRRILIKEESQADESKTPELLPTNQPVETLDQQIVMQTGATMRQYTQTIAEHFSRYLQQQADPRDQKTIIFCVDNAHADEMRMALEKTCAAWTRPGDIVRIVDDDGTEGKRALSQFCTIRERQPVIVTTSQLLSTGVDVPTCRNIVLARGVGSLVEFKQIIGRGTRLAEQKRWFTIFDYSGAIKHFSDPAFDGDPLSVQREYLIPTASTVPTQQEIEKEDETPALPPLPPTTDSAAQEPVILSSLDEQSLNNNGQGVVYSGSQDVPGVRKESILKDGEASIEPVAPASDETVHSSLDADINTQPIPSSTEVMRENTGEIASEEPSAVSHACLNAQPVASTKGKPPIHEHGPASQPRRQANRAPKPPTEDVEIKKENGNRFVISGERFLELDASGAKLREGSPQQFAQQALKDLVKTPEDLRAYWTDRQQRKLLIEQLALEIVALDALAQALHLPDVDYYDLLRHILFQQPTITRQERVQQLRTVHSAFFERFQNNRLAKELLDVILDKYIQEKDLDVSDIGLLGVPPLKDRTRMEWANIFNQGSSATSINAVLKELQRLLYSF